MLTGLFRRRGTVEGFVSEDQRGGVLVGKVQQG